MNVSVCESQWDCRQVCTEQGREHTRYVGQNMGWKCVWCVSAFAYMLCEPAWITDHDLSMCE
jgi:hypothetical protein